MFDAVFDAWFQPDWFETAAGVTSADETTTSEHHASLMLDTERRVHEAAYVDDPSERIAARTPNSEVRPGSAQATIGEGGDPIAPIVDVDSTVGTWTDDASRLATRGPAGGALRLPEDPDADRALTEFLAITLETIIAEREAAFAVDTPVVESRPAETRLINPLGRAEATELAGIVRRLRRQIDGAPSWRRVAGRNGGIDLRRTLRRAVVTGGVPLTVARRGPCDTKGSVLLLADTSLSMRPTIRLMLHVAHLLAAQSSRVRVLAFVDRCLEVTDVIGHLDVARAIGRLLDDCPGGILDPARPSDYGRALDSLWSRYGLLVDDSTTVIVIGDGHSNGRDPNLAAVDRLRRRCRRLVWLTPEPEGAWRFGHGEMQRYADRCDHAATIRSIPDLAALVESRAFGRPLSDRDACRTAC